VQRSDIHLTRLQPEVDTFDLINISILWLVVNAGASIMNCDEEPDVIVEVAQFELIVSQTDCRV
jgi:hypothetical protein